MTDTTIIAIIAAIPPTLAAFAAMIQSMRTAAKTEALTIKTDAQSKDIDATSKKADTIIEKAVAIHELTNGSNHQLQADLKVMTEKVAGLEKLMTNMVEAKAVADKLLVTTAIPPVIPPLAAPIQVDIVKLPDLKKK